MPSNSLTLAKKHDFAIGNEPILTAVLIHGLAADSSSFDNLMAYMKEKECPAGVRIVAFDLLGSGKSLRDDSLNYNYNTQLKALHNSIEALGLSTPLVLVGHSMGTLVVTRYAATHKNAVRELLLISPPVYTIKDLENPAFGKAMTLFKNAVSVRNRKVLEEKPFNDYIDNIVLDRDNYKVLSGIKVPATLIYGSADRFIASHNISGLLRKNPRYLSAIETDGRHGVTKDKFTSVIKTLERIRDDIF